VELFIFKYQKQL